jgi:alkylhydroperoxidase family enzyme
VNSLDGLPLAREFRVVLNGMWSSSTLSSRAVSLIFAVVSRALDSTRCEEEARSRLRIDGLSDDDIDYILAHLSSPLLTQTEKVLVPFARETVWYQPAQIQRRCAEVQKQVSKQEFLHFIGVVSLVNALCRIGFISDIEG